MKYYSEILDKKFDTVEELQKAEEAKALEEKAKAEKSEARKADSALVEKAYQEYHAAYKEYLSKSTELSKIYNQKLREARDEYHKACLEAMEPADKAEQAYKKALNDFIAKHPEGYHLTLRNGDDVVTLSGQTTISKNNLADDTELEDKFWNSWLSFLK